jgi:hypothetical protein
MIHTLTRYEITDGEETFLPATDGFWVKWADVAAALVRYNTAEEQQICIPCDDGVWVRWMDVVALARLTGGPQR